MNSRDSFYVDQALEKLANSRTFWSRVTDYAKDPIVQAGVAIGAGTGVNSAMRDYVPLDPTNPRARDELKRRIGIGAVSGILLGIGASHGMKAFSGQIAKDLMLKGPAIGDALGAGLQKHVPNVGKTIATELETKGGDIGGAIGSGIWDKMKFWKGKTAELEPKEPFNAGHARSRLQDLALIGLGSGLGAGAGYLTGSMLKRRFPSKVNAPLVSTLSGLAVGLAVPAILQYRSAVIDEKMEEAGRAHAARLREKAKISRLLASPQEWNEGERETLGGAGKGALIGFGGAGLASLVTGKFPLAQGVLGGAALGGFLGHRKNKRRELLLQQQYGGQ